MLTIVFLLVYFSYKLEVFVVKLLRYSWLLQILKRILL